MEKVKEEATRQGFRVLHVHDVAETLKEKGFHAAPTAVVEVCNAGLASKALAADRRAALLMPCRVVVQEDPAGSRLTALLPEDPSGGALKELAQEVSARLKALVDTAA